MINIISSSRYKITRRKIKQAAKMIFDEYGLTSNYILNIIFIGKIKMRHIVQKYKKENEALPVLSFPYNKEKTEGNQLLGEVFICYPQAVLLAAQRNKTVDYILTELIKHGIGNLINNRY